MKYVLLLLCLSILFGCRMGEKETYILPKDYSGVVYVFFNQKTGYKPEYNDMGKRIYRIPSTGILKTQFPPNNGLREITEYYYVSDADRKMTPIYYQIENKDMKNNIYQVCCLQSGQSYKKTDEVIEYIRFFIGTEQQIDSIYKIEQEKDISQYIE